MGSFLITLLGNVIAITGAAMFLGVSIRQDSIPFGLAAITMAILFHNGCSELRWRLDNHHTKEQGDGNP